MARVSVLNEILEQMKAEATQLLPRAPSLEPPVMIDHIPEHLNLALDVTSRGGGSSEAHAAVRHEN